MSGVGWYPEPQFIQSAERLPTRFKSGGDAEERLQGGVGCRGDAEERLQGGVGCSHRINLIVRKLPIHTLLERQLQYLRLYCVDSRPRYGDMSVGLRSLAETHMHPSVRSCSPDWLVGWLVGCVCGAIETMWRGPVPHSTILNRNRHHPVLRGEPADQWPSAGCGSDASDGLPHVRHPSAT
jgi:hypothetical protein